MTDGAIRAATGRVDRHREKPSKIGDQRVQWHDRRQFVILPAK
jgi:hypothetical protein